MDVKLTWTPGSGATSQTVQYRQQGSTTWTTYTTINNNTTTSIVLTLPSNDYQFRILNSCTQCVCPEGQTPNLKFGCISPCTQESASSNIISVNQPTGGGNNVVVENLAGTGGSPYVSSSIDDVSPSWFTVDNGSFPVTSGQNITGGQSGYNGSFSVSVSGVGAGCCLILYKNTAVYMTVQVNSSGTYQFTNVSYSGSDVVKLELVSTGC
jgi:hypothetical protein